MLSFCSRVVGSSSSNLRSFSTSSILSSSKKGGGSSKNNRNSAGKRLGVKKYQGELVQPGSIIIRQRGFKIHPGQNVSFGRDHTLTALIPGYVKYYQMPHNPKNARISPNIPNTLPRDANWDVKLPKTNKPLGWRHFVGVVFNREDSLPRDEKSLGRERVWLGEETTREEVETGVFDFVREGEEEGGEGGVFEKRKMERVVIPKRKGRVVNGEIVPAAMLEQAEGSASVSLSTEGLSASA